MIRLSVFLIFFLTLNFATAQELRQFRKFRVLPGAGYATGSGYRSGGIFASLEPAYRLSDRIIMGLRGELAGIARGDYERLSVNIDVSKISSFTLNAVYYFDDDVVRPFAGFGAGNYRLSSITYRLDGSGTDRATGKETVFGFYPRAGVEIGHFHFSADYNIIPTTNRDNAEFRNSYLAIRVGLFFGGGRKPDQIKY